MRLAGGCSEMHELRRLGLEVKPAKVWSRKCGAAAHMLHTQLSTVPGTMYRTYVSIYRSSYREPGCG